MTKFKKTVLDNGITVVTEEHPQSHAVSCGIWVKTGTRHERAVEMGISHFLEHMVFKGTKTRSAYQLVRALESVGGDLNAYTTREYTCYHSLSLPEHLTLSLDVLADIVQNASFPHSEMELERGVILQEIAAAQENHEEYLYDTFFEKIYGAASLGYPILGTEQTIKSIKRNQLLDYYRKNYLGSNLVVSVAGQLDHDQVVDVIEKTLGRNKARPRTIRTKRPGVRKLCEIIESEADQVHILVGLPAPSFKDRLRFEGFVFNALLGGGMTSHLYQKIREKKGLVYSVYSSLNTFNDSGMLTVYASSSEDNFQKVLTLILEEIKRVKKKGLTSSEVKLFKTQVRGGILLGADDLENRMNSLGVNEMVFGRYRPIEEIVEEVERVDDDSMHAFIKNKVQLNKMGVLVLGPKGTREHLSWAEDLVEANS